MGTCVVSISNKMQSYTVYLYLETTLHVSGGTSTHHQERIQMYRQHLVFVTPLLLSAPYRGRVGTGLSVLWVAYATVVTDQSWKIQRTQRHTVTGGCMCRIRRLLMMGTRVPETCRAE
jgi:hypothetical protein